MKPYRTLACLALVATVSSAVAAEEATPSPRPTPPKKESPAGPRTTRVMEIKNRDLMGDLERLVDGFGIPARTSPELGLMILTGAPDVVAAAAEAIRKYDVARERKPKSPARNVELTAELVFARADGDAAPVGSALAPVIEQLKSTFSYKRYELVDTLTLRVKDDAAADSSGVLPALSSGVAGKTFYALRANRVHIEGPTGTATVTLNPITFKIEAPFPSDIPSTAPAVQRRENILSTTTDVREGQKVVLGKAAVDGSGNALILVLTAKVVE
jgi:hypothetical protein